MIADSNQADALAEARVDGLSRANGLGRFYRGVREKFLEANHRAAASSPLPIAKPGGILLQAKTAASAAKVASAATTPEAYAARWRSRPLPKRWKKHRGVSAHASAKFFKISCKIAAKNRRAFA